MLDGWIIDHAYSSKLIIKKIEARESAEGSINFKSLTIDWDKFRPRALFFMLLFVLYNSNELIVTACT